MSAAMAAIAERGLSRVRMADIAKIAGMSPGHILYYFKSKDELLVRTLLWSEDKLTARRREELAAIEDARGRLRRFVEIYVPTGPGDPAWALWLAGYGLVLAHPDIYLTVEEVVLAYQDDLRDIVEFGIGRGEFEDVDADEFAERYCALLNGYSISLAAGDPRFDREIIVDRILAAAASELGIEREALAG